MTFPPRPEEIERFRTFIARKIGLSFDDAKLGFLAEVLRRRAEHGHRGSDVYLAALETDAARSEIGAIARELTVPETYFFRNVDQFRAFTEACLPERVRARGAVRSLRFLSAGCASGEEAYSIAIYARELVDPSWDVRILGIDINPAVLEKAARARFSSWALRGTSPEMLQKWFRMEGRDALLDDSARSLVTFQERNLVDEDAAVWQAETYDVIFCRNVLMYLTPSCARGVVTRISRALAPGGYLFLGHAETLRGLSGDFHLQHTHGTFYYRRRGPGEASSEDIPIPRALPSSSQALPLALVSAVEGSDSWVEVIQKASARVQALTQSPKHAAPVSPRRRSELGVALDLLQKERFSDALDVVQALPIDARRDPDVLLLHAVLLTHSGRLTEAESLCSTLLRIDEHNAGAHYVLALCREGAGDRKGALEEDRVAVYLDPAFAMPRLHLGLLARKANERETARRELGQALVLLQREDPARLLLFGGGFGRETLVALCQAEIAASGGRA